MPLSGSIIRRRCPMESIELSAYDQSWYDRGRSAAVAGLWDLVETFLIHPSPHACFAWRRFWYRRFGAAIGRGVRIRKSVKCTHPWKLAIGDHAWIGDEATLYCLERVSIGANAVVSQQAYVCTGSHDHRDPAFGLRVSPVTIGDGAWVALGAVVMPGVTVGEGALIGARAVLTRDALPWTIYLGSPARASSARTLDGGGAGDARAARNATDAGAA